MRKLIIWIFRKFGLLVIDDRFFAGSDMLSCPYGIYRIYWKSGGDSIAAVGGLSNGERWIAPTNWTGREYPTGNMFDQLIKQTIDKIELLKL